MLRCPWNSPGKNTEVGCHALLEGIFPTHVSCISCIADRSFTAEPLGKPFGSRPHPFFFLSLVACHTFMSNFIRHATCVYAQSLLPRLTLCNPIPCRPSGSSVHGIFPSKNIGVCGHAILQGIFPTQGSNPCLLGLLHWQVASLPLVLPGKPQGMTHP